MSKFLKIMIVLLTIAAVATPVIAEDRLGLSGQMRVRAWSLDDGTDNTSFMDQRLRIGGKFSIADGVSVSFRTDVTEQTWGNGGSEFGSGRMPQDAQQWDRAYMDLNKGNLHLRAGQMYAGYGLMGGTINSQDAGLKIDVKGPITFSAFWLLDDQNGGTDTADSYLTAANIQHKTDNYKANIFVGNQLKAKNTRESVYLVGANVRTKLGGVAITSELDFFTGDANSDNATGGSTDAVGTQFYLDGAMAASDSATVGASFYYAVSADADEVQYQNLGNDFNGWDPLTAQGTSLSNEKLKIGRPFDFTGDGAGAIGGQLYVKLKTSDTLDLGASFAYLIPEDDALTLIDSAYVLAGSAVYKVMSNTKLQALVQYVDADVETVDTDGELGIGVGLYVNF